MIFRINECCECFHRMFRINIQTSHRQLLFNRAATYFIGLVLKVSSSTCKFLGISRIPRSILIIFYISGDDSTCPYCRAWILGPLVNVFGVAALAMERDLGPLSYMYIRVVALFNHRCRVVTFLCSLMVKKKTHMLGGIRSLVARSSESFK